MSFIGRTSELNELENAYSKDSFEMAVIYGRRRVGKSTLIAEFLKDKKSINFTALETSAKKNLELFTKSILLSSGAKYKKIPSYGNYEDALDAIYEIAKEEQITLVIDEYPYLAKSESSISSLLQYYIDAYFKNTSMMIILCGSSMSFMENQVLGYQSPLYGRRTMQIKVLPFDYLTSAEFVSGYDYIDKAICYGITGGIPKYLEFLDENKPTSENIIDLFLSTNGYLFEETSNLLKQELREPAYYNAVIESIAKGASRINEIATSIGKERDFTSVYLKALGSLGIIKKETSFGEEKNKKKTIYQIEDSMFLFWYKFIPQNMELILSSDREYLYNEIIAPKINEFMGGIFEEMCKQYLRERSKIGKLPFKIVKMGRWWGADENAKSQQEIDIVCTNINNNEFLFAECKFRNEPIKKPTLEQLMYKATLISNGTKCYYALFSKSGFTKEIHKMAGENTNIMLISLEDMYERKTLELKTQNYILTKV